jgi:hypothetical protein
MNECERLAEEFPSLLRAIEGNAESLQTLRAFRQGVESLASQKARNSPGDEAFTTR